MDLNTLQEFRHGMYHCFGNAKDALFNLVDALSSEAGASSFPELSFSPFFERTWASCMKLWKTARSMPSDCARSLWTSRHCHRQVRSFFWGWTPATVPPGGRDCRGPHVGSHGQF